LTEGAGGRVSLRAARHGELRLADPRAESL
jgi:hypothetical protein